MNHGKFVFGGRLRRLSFAAVGVVLLQTSLPCLAQLKIAVAGSSRYEYDSNVLDIQGGQPVPGTTDYQHSDWLYTYGAALDVNYLLDRQVFFARLSDNEFHYDHFTLLDHNEYGVDAGLNWKLFHALDGTVELQRNRSMVAFTNVNNAQFDLQTEQRELAKVGFTVMPEWRIEGSGYYRTVDQVFLEAPTLNLRESSGTLALLYLGRGGLTAGLSGGYTDGDYTGASAATNPSYTQNSYSATAVYRPTGRSTINGVVGYSERRSASELNSISGFTGELDYDDQLTGKTTIHVLINRAINSYVANVSSEIDSSAAFNVHWQATYKLGVVAGYNWTTRNLPGEGPALPGAGLAGAYGTRIDHLQYAAIALDYEPFRWLTLKPYINYVTRKSNILGGDFDSSVYGIFFTVKWQNSREPDPLFQHINEPALIR